MRAIIPFFLLFMCYASANSQNQIVGVWDVNWNSTKASMNSAENEKFSGMPETTQQRVKTTFSSRTYTFQANGSIQISWEIENNQKNVNGTWSINGNTLTISADGKENLYTVEFNGNSLTLSKQGERNLFSVLVFNKRG